MSKFNFFSRPAVSSTSFADLKLTWDFVSAGIVLLNESTTSGRIIEYSFDGVNVHGDLDPDLSTAGIAFNNRHESVIFFRLKTAGAAATVRVEAWA